MKVLHLFVPHPAESPRAARLFAAVRALNEPEPTAELWVVRRRHNKALAETWLKDGERAGIPVAMLDAWTRDEKAIGELILQEALAAGADVLHLHGRRALRYATAVPSPHLGRVAQTIATTAYVPEGVRAAESGGLPSPEAEVRAWRDADAVIVESFREAQRVAGFGVPSTRVHHIAPLCATVWDSSPAYIQARPPTGVGLRRIVATLPSMQRPARAGMEALLARMAHDPSMHPTRLTILHGDEDPASVYQTAVAWGLGNRVFFAPMGSPPATTELHHADAVIVPAEENCDIDTTLEAMGRGVPLLLPGGGDCAQWIHLNENALLFSVPDPTDFAHALHGLGARLAALQVGARNRAAEVRYRHSPQAWAASARAAYDQAHAGVKPWLGEPPASPGALVRPRPSLWGAMARLRASLGAAASPPPPARPGNRSAGGSEESE